MTTVSLSLIHIRVTAGFRVTELMVSQQLHQFAHPAPTALRMGQSLWAKPVPSAMNPSCSCPQNQKITQ